MKHSRRSSSAIISIFLVVMGSSAVTPAIQSIADAFPDISYTNVLLVNTLPMLLVIPFSIFTGIVTGSKIRYKTMASCGLILFLIGGIAPLFMNSFVFIILARIVFGIGVGIIFPLGNALILNLYEGQTRASLLGIGTAVSFLGGIIFQIVGAYLCSLNWHYTFLVHALALISLVIVLLFLPEPEKARHEAGQKAKLPILVYGVCIFFCITITLIYPAILNMSSIIVSGQIGTVTSAGIVLSLMTLGGFVAGAVYGKVFQLLSRFTLALSFLLFAVAMGFVNYGNSLMLFSLGMVLIGLGVGLLIPFVSDVLGMIVPAAALSASMGIMMAAQNLGTFLTSFYMSGLTVITGNATPKYPVFLSMVIFAVGMVVLVIMNIRTPKVKKADSGTPSV